MGDIFISYSREDKTTARRFADALIAQGFDVWWDDSLRSGEAFDSVIEAALRAAKAVIVLWSKTSVASRWVRAEATAADGHGTLMPVLVEPCERPIIFHMLHTTNLSRWNGNIADPAWQGFVADLRRRVSGETQAAKPPPLSIGEGLKLPDKPSIAVLPFTNLAGAQEQDYFADGVVEEISTALSHFQTLFVIAGATSLTYRDPNRDPAKICRELGVRYVLEGSVRRSGSRIRITAKLIDGIAGEQIWADHFDDNLDDIFELQDRVAATVAGVMNSSIDTAEVKRAVNRPTTSPDAMELYWRANAVFRKWDRESLSEAIGLTERVLEMDPDNAWAAALAGFCHASAFSNRWTDDLLGSRNAALAYYDRAMRFGGDDPRVLGYCSAIQISVGGDGDVATRLVDRTLELNPGSATSLFWGGWNDAINGQAERGLERLEASLRLNPRSMVRPLTITGLGICLFELRRFQEAATLLSEAIQQLPYFPPALAGLAASLAHAGRRDEAHAIGLRLKAVGGASGVLAFLRNPDHLDMMNTGIALAEREPPRGTGDTT